MRLTKELFLSLDILPDVLDRINDGVNVVDTDGILVYVNEISANYAGKTKEEMIGKPITDFYPAAVLLTVLQDRKPVLDKTIHFVPPKKYIVNSYPIVHNGKFLGAFSVFQDIQELDQLNSKIKQLEIQVKLTRPEGDFNHVVHLGTMQSVFRQAKKIVGSLGGPRHSIITGASGTGKTMLANLIYNYAKEIGVISKNAPFIEINCAQFTNPDIAAMEIFGSVEGAYTGSKKKKGLFEQANGGILFLDEAHTIENYQNLLLKAIESGKIRRIGDTREVDINVIVIAASTKNLHEVFLPELYQRLGQYEMYLPSLQERSLEEKEQLFLHFVKKYETAVWEARKIHYHVVFTPQAKHALLNAVYPRNIRQMRDVINYSIDASSPLIEDIGEKTDITTTVGLEHIPFDVSDKSETEKNDSLPPSNKITEDVAQFIFERYQNGDGPRKISNRLTEMGYDLPYYKVAYYLKKEYNQEGGSK
ncbi:sigma 54-interacting transcriptional regulator [Anaerotignum propionicum]|uniref:sigma 54-interacting transcriptional regulator n=1 Tax=Anaerotignum propionicum TaxID=28446 RepID=UPI00210EAAC5|nr:sigma 54-interacting transcriptional regulator [Anaerotignum propionicum]MCQ4936104.1 sigma 54-interacting transcriptional regulator [Anaerotignum propionicum]